MGFIEIRRRLWCPIGRALRQMEACLKRWTESNSDSLLMGTIGDLTRSGGNLIAENAFLRQQVIVLKRQSQRPRLTRRDRALMMLLASKVRGWLDALLLVKPDPLVKWPRAGFRLFWRHKSTGKARVLRMSPEAIALIKEMAVAACRTSRTREVCTEYNR